MLTATLPKTQETDVPLYRNAIEPIVAAVKMGLAAIQRDPLKRIWDES